MVWRQPEHLSEVAESSVHVVLKQKLQVEVKQ